MQRLQRAAQVLPFLPLCRHGAPADLGGVGDGGLEQGADAGEDAEQRHVYIALRVGGHRLAQELVARQVAVAEVKFDLTQGQGGGAG